MDNTETKYTINRTLAYQLQKDAKSNERRQKEERKLARKAEQKRWTKKDK